jgi:hypothetical protein
MSYSEAGRLVVNARVSLLIVTWVAFAAAWLLGCGSGDSSRSPTVAPDAGGCTKGRCCADVDWMLIIPVETGVGGGIDFDVSVTPTPHRPFTVKWTAEGGDVEKARTEHARFTCRYPGIHKVNLTIANDWCEMSQESHIKCVD